MNTGASNFSAFFVVIAFFNSSFAGSRPSMATGKTI